MPLSIKQLISLYILQKNHHLDPQDLSAKAAFENAYKTHLPDHLIHKEHMMAPAMFQGQPNIPFALFKPVDADANTPRPLVIHTHGGPHVYMDIDKLHAEIAWFLSHGYIVACPNYRGSTGYPEIGDDKPGWEEWIDKSVNKHHIYGPEDVFAVAKMMQGQPCVNPDKLFLRGCSYGSHINAHLLAGVSTGKFENIFSGAHLSGGVNYPVSSALPDDVPLLVTHSEKDDIAPFEDARIFMEKLLLKQLGADNGPNGVQTFVAHHGNHHLIDPQLEEFDDPNESFTELVRYLELTTDFIDSLNKGMKFKITDSLDQYKALMRHEKWELNADEQIQIRARTWHFTQKMQSREKITKQNTHSLQIVPFELENNTPCGPSMALLKVQLGARFTGNIRQDFVEYLTNDFSPISWTNEREKLTDAGHTMLADQEYIEQIIRMYGQEEAFLKQNPDHFVMYHAAENTGLQLYCFINLWLSILKGELATSLPVIPDMRLFDFMKQSIEDIDIFLLKMRRLKSSTEIFNNTPGFPERAIACNPAITSNPHSTAACSLWWYFKAEENERPPMETVIGDLLKVLGIYSPERMSRYIQLFKREKQLLQGTRQALMQQIFIPCSLAEKSAYLCQLWGEEFKENDMTLKSPRHIRTLIENPELLEEKLRNNKHLFTNFGECKGFGDTDKGFNYTSTLQIRYLPKMEESIITNSYFRNPDLHQHLVTALNQLILEDYADFLAYGNKVPDFIIKGTDKVTSSIYTNNKFRLFKPTISNEAFYNEQFELYRGLVQNPHKDMYGGIIALDKHTKTTLQERLRNATGNISPHPVFPYSLCRYLQGYTYYDLIREAAAASLIDNPKIFSECKIMAAQTFDKLMETIDAVSLPSSVSKVNMIGERYLNFYKLIHNKIGRHQFNPQVHQFMQPPGKSFYKEDLWAQEISTAIDCVLKYARLAKEKGYGYDVDDALLKLY